MSDRAIPGRPFTELALDVVDEDESWSVRDATPEQFTLLVFYRGKHCPLCQKQLEELNRRITEFAERGVDVVAISCDDSATAEETVDEWEVADLPIAYGLGIDAARNLGLYISESIKDDEPGNFSEPGLFLLDVDGNLHAAWIQSVPFARPTFDDILHAIDQIQKKDYPPRGTVD
jgi:peroxiredoxin